MTTRAKQTFSLILTLALLLTTAQTAWATTTSTITVGGTDYVLFTGFTATDGTATGNAFVYGNMVDGNTSTSFHAFTSPAFVEFNTDDPVIPKGYIFNTYMAGKFYPQAWVLKAKANAEDGWTTLSSYSGQTLSSGQEFQYACGNDGNTPYKYFRFEASNTANNIWMTEIRLYGSVPDVYYTHLTVKAATCTETGIKQDCYQRNDGKYFTDETGETELAESDVIDPMIAHTGVHHEATDTHIEYWQCSMCSKYFSNEGCTTEITEEQTKIYRTITIDASISGLVSSDVNQALAGSIVTLTVSNLVDAATLKVNDGTNDLTLTDEGNNKYTFTVPAANVTVTASISSTYAVTLPDNMQIVSATNEADGNGKYISGTVVTFAPSFGYVATNVSDGTNTLEPDASGIYTVTVADADINITANIESSNTLYLATAASDFTAVDGNILIGSTSHTVTIANGANVTLNNATITGGIVCDGSATITLVGTNSVTGATNKAGIQIGGSGTTLTINGDGSLTATGGNQSAGIGLSRIWNYDSNVASGNIVIEGGTITATGGNWGAGIGIGTVKNTNNDNSTSVQFGNITIKGGSVTAIGGDSGDGIGKGYAYSGPTITIGTVTIYDGIDKVDASSIKDFASVVYMHVDGETETDVTANKTDYFTIIENGDRRIIVQKVNPTIAEIPDQTYTGSAITPEPTVIAGSLSLTKGTDYEFSYENNTNVGTATVRATFQGTFASLGYVERTFTIQPKPITVTADNQTKEYGEADPTLTATVEGLIGEDAITYTLSRTEGEAVGTYDITPTGDAAQGNYAVTFVAGTMTITSNPTLALTANLASDENYWTTFFCGDAGYTINDAENACAYTATYADGKLTLHNQGKEIPQGTAVIIVADNNEVSMTKTTLSAFSGDNSLRGVDVETSTDDIQTTLGTGTFYVLGMTNGHFGFHKYGGSEMAARKAFVLVNGSNAALARSLTMVFEGDATGITTVHGSGFTVNGSDAWYSLDGRRLQGKPTKSGVYVNNGKKIVIK